MADPFSAIAGIGSSLLGGLFGKKGARDQNKTQIKMAREQMRFQKEMSSTAHRREVEDLKLAGLNPILSGTGGSGASSPGGAQPSIVNEYSEMANSARDIGDKLRQNPLLNAQIANQKAENERIKEQTRQLQISNAQQSVLTPAYIEAGKAVDSGIKGVKSILGIKDAGDIVKDVLDAGKGASGALATGEASLPNSAFDLTRLVGTENSEARKWARGEKGFWDSVIDASRPENNVPSAKRLTEEKVRQAGERRIKQMQENKKDHTKDWFRRVTK